MQILLALPFTTSRKFLRSSNNATLALRVIGNRVARSYKSTLAATTDYASDPPQKDHASIRAELQRLRHIRNVGVFAHVDAGKTTVTERMLALAGVVRQAGSVDDGNSE